MITDNIVNAFRSERLIYRAIEDSDSDIDFLHAGIDNEPVNTALADMAMVQPRGKRQTHELLENLRKATLAVMICLAGEGGEGSATATTSSTPNTPSEPIGFIVVGWGGKPANHAQHRSTTIGIQLATQYQNHGYGGEAINWALDWAFRFGGFHRVAIGTVSYNERARHLYTRLGFVEEGRLRESHWFDRKWHDTIQFSMLESEWEILRGLKE